MHDVIRELEAASARAALVEQDQQKADVYAEAAEALVAYVRTPEVERRRARNKAARRSRRINRKRGA